MAKMGDLCKELLIRAYFVTCRKPIEALDILYSAFGLKTIITRQGLLQTFFSSKSINSTILGPGFLSEHKQNV